jgi:hypothetical protein
MKLDEILIIKNQPAFELVPDRLTIASRLLAAMLASGKYERHFIDAAVPDAVDLTDKLISCIKETQK